jgi:hypothetical protein
MRILLALIFPLLLAGCPSGKAPSSERSSPPDEKAAPGSGGTSTNQNDFTGVWATTDAQGQLFNIIIFPNGQAVTNWTKGTEGARGERGLWRQEPGRFIAAYDDGWTDLIEVDDGQFHHKGFSPGTSLDGPPSNQAPAAKVKESQAPYVGVWRMNKEPDGSYLYIALQSNGRAYSSINGGTEGTWEPSEKGALCRWPDGWVDLIERAPEGWQKRSWVGVESNTTADFSTATRVGETRFVITP